MALVGIDLGGRRIGVALSESGTFARPHSVLRNEGDVIETVASLGRQLNAETFVIGIPLRAHASRVDMVAAAVILQSYLDDLGRRTS